jgi:hypothetical protein
MTRYLLLFDSYGLVFCGALSLTTRRRVCLFYMLLTLASAVFLRSESLGTHDHNFLSRFWDFPLCRLLRLTGSWWRYSTPPPHTSVLTRLCFDSPYIPTAQTQHKTSFLCWYGWCITCSIVVALSAWCWTVWQHYFLQFSYYCITSPLLRDNMFTELLPCNGLSGD